MINKKYVDITKKTSNIYERRIIYVIILFIILYIHCENIYYDNGVENFELSGFWNTIIHAIIMLLVPGIIRIIKKEKLNFYLGIIVCFSSCITIFIISTLLNYSINYCFIDWMSTFIYYWINIFLFVKTKKDSNNIIANKNIKATKKASQTINEFADDDDE